MGAVAATAMANRDRTPDGCFTAGPWHETLDEALDETLDEALDEALDTALHEFGASRDGWSPVASDG